MYHLRMKIFERIAPSTVLWSIAGAVGTVLGGLEVGLALFGSFLVASVGHWLDHYGLDQV